MSEGLKVISRTYDLLKWLLPLVSKFPRDKRYTLGQRLENKLLDILALLLEANYSKVKIDLLKKANLELEIMRHLVRLCYDLQYMNLGRYEFCSGQLNEIGKLVGGWIRQQAAR
ncbi:diversity-generating retroelement protein Avd [Candidatus Saganbacteria bacterium]|nr:diversity-generating retroelement protein Avd [Candidatus Saganbacteria bacterium]